MRGAKEESLPGRPDTSFFFLSLVLLLGLIDSVGDCLFKLLGPEVVGKPWPAVPVGFTGTKDKHNKYRIMIDRLPVSRLRLFAAVVGAQKNSAGTVLLGTPSGKTIRILDWDSDGPFSLASDFQRRVGRLSMLSI
jgi:hypothetical protein